MRALINGYFFSVSSRNILLTGIQPTGDLHIGNYLGAISNMLKYQQVE